MSTLGIIGGVLLVGGGVYVAYKMGLLQNVGANLENIGTQMKNSFIEGYHEASKAS